MKNFDILTGPVRPNKSTHTAFSSFELSESQQRLVDEARVFVGLEERSHNPQHEFYLRLREEAETGKPVSKAAILSAIKQNPQLQKDIAALAGESSPSKKRSLGLRILKGLGIAVAVGGALALGVSVFKLATADWDSIISKVVGSVVGAATRNAMQGGGGSVSEAKGDVDMQGVAAALAGGLKTFEGDLKKAAQSVKSEAGMKSLGKKLRPHADKLAKRAVSGAKQALKEDTAAILESLQESAPVRSSKPTPLRVRSTRKPGPFEGPTLSPAHDARLKRARVLAGIDSTASLYESQSLAVDQLVGGVDPDQVLALCGIQESTQGLSGRYRGAILEHAATAVVMPETVQVFGQMSSPYMTAASIETRGQMPVVEKEEEPAKGGAGDDAARLKAVLQSEPKLAKLFQNRDKLSPDAKKKLHATLKAKVAGLKKKV